MYLTVNVERQSCHSPAPFCNGSGNGRGSWGLMSTTLAPWTWMTKPVGPRRIPITPVLLFRIFYCSITTYYNEPADLSTQPTGGNGCVPYSSHWLKRQWLACHHVGSDQIMVCILCPLFPYFLSPWKLEDEQKQNGSRQRRTPVGRITLKKRVDLTNRAKHLAPSLGGFGHPWWPTCKRLTQHEKKPVWIGRPIGG